MKQRTIKFSVLLIIFLLSGIIASAAADPGTNDGAGNGTNANTSFENGTTSTDNGAAGTDNSSDNTSAVPPADNTSSDVPPANNSSDVPPPADNTSSDVPPANNTSSDVPPANNSSDVTPANNSRNVSVIISFNGTSFEPGDTVNITADFNRSVDHASISITPNLANFNRSHPNSLVGASNEFLVTDAPMTQIDDNTFSYNSLIPQDLMGLFNIDISAFDTDGTNLPVDVGAGNDGAGIDLGGFEVDPYIDIISPTSEFASKNCVDFNFTAYDYAGFGQAGSEVVYTFWLDGVQVNNGVITSGAYKQLQFELADGKHTWEVQTKDSTQQEHTTGTRTLYVDTKCPIVTLVSPQDCFKQVIGTTQFNFTCEDALAAQHSDLGLTYTLYVDGQVAQRFGNMGDNITGTAQSGVPVTQSVQLDDGAHNWSVSVQDRAGNSVTSEVRKFDVDLNGLTVASVTPNGGYVSANPTFNFTVRGGAGLPFNYKLLVDGKEIMKSNCDGNCNGGYTGDEGEDGCNVCVQCSEEGDGKCFVVGSNIYSLKAAVADGVNKNWTVIVTDITTGKEYQTDLKTFSVDSVAPAPVAHLYSQDKPGVTKWTELSNSPGLDVYWIPNNEKDLVTPTPYEVYISTSEPSRIEDMELVNKTNLPIDEILKCGGKPLVYGKDYWVAVIARDNASNYDKNFSVYGPVRTYEGMDIPLNEGWNLKSVPENLVDDSPASVFGENNTVLYWDGSCWQFPDTIEPCKGYWVYCQHPFQTTVQFKGMSSDCADPNVPASQTLTPGWNMIGHTSTYAAPWSVTLSSLSGISLANLITDYKFSNLITYNQNEGWGGIIPDVANAATTGEDAATTGVPQIGSNMYSSTPLPVGALQSDNYMVPGQGYWIFMKNEGIYGSIQNVYQDLGQNTDNGTNGGTNELPEGVDLNNQSTWPEGFDPSQFLSGMQ